jgi:hypothetical protein
MRILSKATGRLCLSSISLILWLSIAGSSAATTIDANNSGLDQASGCADLSCFDVIYDVVSNPGTVSGSLALSAGVLDFSIALDGASLSASGGDGRVAGIVFHVIYSGQVNVSLDASNNYVIDPGQTAQITGTATPIGAGSPVPVAASASLLTGTCSGDPASSMLCGLIFSPVTDFQAEINGNTRYFEHSVGVVTVIPEPNTAVMLGLGLASLAGARRRAKQGARAA